MNRSIMRTVSTVLMATLFMLPAAGDSSAATASVPAVAVEVPVETGTDLWNDGQVEEARSMWLLGLARNQAPERQARLLYNLGVAAHVGGDPLRATARFEGALRLLPRYGNALHNRDISRADAGLDPVDSGSIGATFGRLAGAFTRVESEWLALLGAFVGAVAFACLGLGRARPLAWILLLSLPVLFVPLGRSLLSGEEDPVMVIAKSGASVTAFAREGAERLGSLPPGAVVPRVETYGEAWTKVIYRGEERWVESDRVLGLLP